MSKLFPDTREVSKTAINILQKRYFAEGETSWKDVTNRVVDHVLKNTESEQKELTRQMIQGRYFIPNSPCLVNSGKENAGLCACFVVDFPDTIEGIYQTKLDFALIARKGGGCGTSLSKIRPEGARVHGSTHGYAGGPLKFADTISHDADALTQAGFRSMAIMFTQSVYHPDIMKFLTAKKEEGRIANANISVVVDDAFMQKVENDETYWTEFNGEKYQEYRARDIFDMIVEGAWQNGEPGILYGTRISDSPYAETGQEIFATNPCFSGEMKLLTKDGYVNIALLESQEVDIVDGNGAIQRGSVHKTGFKNTIKVKLSNKQEIICTPDHILKTYFGDTKAQDSKGLQLYPFLKYRELDDKFTLFGFIQGDGVLGRLKSNQHLGVDVNIGNKDQDIYKLLNNYKYTTQESSIYLSGVKDELISLKFDSNKLPEREFPETYAYWNKVEKASFLRGCFSANGSINNYARITYKATCKNFILQLQETLEKDFDISSYITTNKSHNIKFSNGDYKVKESYDINISEYESKIKFYNEINFYQDYKIEKLKTQLLETSPYVTAIKENGTCDVYDFTLPELHWGVVNGFIVHNCSEQPLPPNGVCNLGSIDISKFLDNNRKFDWQKFEVAIRLGVRFLDTVVDVSSYPTKAIEQWAKANRSIGLGIMGFADYLLLKEIAYGSERSITKLDSIMEFMRKISYDESEKLGEEFGVPEMCQKLAKPRRNITCITVAPTGTISIFAGGSSGIEPVFSEITIRNDKTGSYTFVSDLAEKEYFRCAVSSNGTREVTPEEHIKILATAQKHVDSGVSKTINYPTKTHRDTIAKGFIMAWKLGCKGLAVYRNGSRKVEVLSPKNLQKDKCPSCGNELVHVNGCKKCISPTCTWNFCGDSQ